jgi:hypothetical protein
MNNKEIASLLKDALENQDTDAIWFAIGELEKSEELKCDDCGELALEDNACADHKGECFDCCGCGQLEDAAAK